VAWVHPGGWKEVTMSRGLILGFALIAASAVLGAEESLSGTYVMAAPNSTLTLVLRQDAQGGLQGTLSSTTGGSFRLEGTVSDGEGFGTCQGAQGGSYFEAQYEGERLLLLLIEPGADRAPDYSRARLLTFARRDGAAPGTPAGPTVSSIEPTAPVGREPGAAAAPGAAPAPAGAGGALSGEEVSDPAWPFTFRVPAGWKCQKGGEAALLGHDTVPGVVMVFPHQATDLASLQQLLRQGMEEEGLQLRLTGDLEPLASAILAGDYAGLAQGSEVKARGVGVVFTQGQGACVVALATPQAYGNDLKAAAETVARSLRAAASTAGTDLARRFVGTWATMTGSTQTTVTLYPDGTFSRLYEGSFAGRETGDWGYARNDRSRGRWTVRGTPQQGVLVLVDPDGGQTTVRYQVHVEKGETYWREYFFNGTLYGKQ
jgi:hypothetical protein